MKYDQTEFGYINIFEMKNCLIVPILIDLYDEFIDQLKIVLLERLKKSSIIGIVIDLSAINVIDSFNFKNIIQIGDMTRLMGKEMVVIGFKPSVAGALSELTEFDSNKIITSISLEASIRYLISRQKNKYKNHGSSRFNNIR